jgi:hypothetical protein
VDATGKRAEAIAAYERAAAIYPDAQSPWLALSELAARAGDRAAAQTAANATLTGRSRQDGLSDPWWSYHTAAGRSVHQRLADLVGSFAERGPR